jgi:hypothetical protein
MIEPNNKQIIIRTMREIPIEWQEVISLAEKIPHGEIVLRIQDKKVMIAEYTIKRKPGSTDDFNVTIL